MAEQLRPTGRTTTEEARRQRNVSERLYRQNLGHTRSYANMLRTIAQQYKMKGDAFKKISKEPVGKQLKRTIEEASRRRDFYCRK